MKTEIRSLEEAEEKKGSYFAYLEKKLDSENNVQRERMKKIINLAMLNELTKRQRDCIDMKYFKEMKVVQIAQSLGISSAAVYKHIRKGMQTLKHYAIYF